MIKLTKMIFGILPKAPSQIATPLAKGVANRDTLLGG